MKFSNLASILETHGKPSSDILLMVPFHKEYGHLPRHLGALNAQTSHGFDLILPLGLAGFATMRTDAAKDAPITYGMVELGDNIAVRLRKEQERMPLP